MKPSFSSAVTAITGHRPPCTSSAIIARACAASSPSGRPTRARSTSSSPATRATSATRTSRATTSPSPWAARVSASSSSDLSLATKIRKSPPPVPGGDPTPRAAVLYRILALDGLHHRTAVEHEDLRSEVGVHVVGAHERRDLAPGQLLDGGLGLLPHRLLEGRADREHLLLLPPARKARSPLVNVSCRRTTTRLSRMTVRAFVGPRPVYSDSSRTTMVEIAAASCPPGESFSALAGAMSSRSRLPGPG